MVNPVQNEVRTIASAVNECIEVCVDGQKLYALAAADVRDPMLKAMFQKHSDQRASYVAQLQAALAKLGATPENQGTARGIARRGAMELRHGVQPMHHDWDVVRSCLRDEEAALRRYNAAGRWLNEFPVDLRVVYDEQRAGIQAALDETRSRLDSH